MAETEASVGPDNNKPKCSTVRGKYDSRGSGSGCSGVGGSGSSGGSLAGVDRSCGRHGHHLIYSGVLFQVCSVFRATDINNLAIYLASAVLFAPQIKLFATPIISAANAKSWSFYFVRLFV
jgi:hypothetical protein